MHIDLYRLAVSLHDFMNNLNSINVLLIYTTNLTVPFHLYFQELEKFEQYIFADCTDFINVENVYEDILMKTLTPEVNKGG